uniref:MobF family relaxase n=1 Tax=Roseihalotalea indica TaxID=2867963 RepID=A0AA49JB94_9BACT|nr:MobF family relaxase [Tunicatimonas sp. TK19036]
MLGIHKSYNSVAATQYFTNSLSTEGYYLKDDVKSQWQGKTAQYLGMQGQEVTRENFSDLVNNIHPETKQRLTVRNAENRRAGFDFTFSASKSASVMYGITKDPEILEAHRHAYGKAMQAIEADIQTQANTKDERNYETTGNIIYAPFDHFTSRPSEVIIKGKKTYVSDPQLHTHCYVPNVTWNAKKGRFQALEVGNIHRLASYYEAVYHAHLSHRLNEIGYQTRRTHKRYEIEGVSRDVIERFSNRTKLIEQTAREKGITDAKAKAALGVKTRHSKAKGLNEKELQRHWVGRLSPSELKDLQTLKGKAQKIPSSLDAAQAVDRSLDHHLERNSAVQEKRVLASALALGYGTLLPKDVQKDLDARKNILRSDRDTITYITTKEMVRAEDRMIELATSGKGKFAPLHPSYTPKQDFLNQQQRKAIKDLLASTDQVTILRGAAGVGKTSLLTEVREASIAAGKSLYGVAPSSQAAKVLEQKGFEANTIAGLLHNKEAQDKLQNNVLLVDEASLCGVKVKTQLLELAKEKNTRVILSGDIGQHGPPGQYGDALRILQEKAKLKTAHVQKIVRQKPEQYRKAVEELSRGNTLEGYQVLNRMGAVKEIPEAEDRLRVIADDYIGSIKSNRSALIVSPTHAEGDLINDIVRDKLKSEGRIKGKERTFTTYKNLSFTESQKKDLALYEEGQVVRFIKNQKGGYKAGAHYEILPREKSESASIRCLETGKVFKLPNNRPQNYQVYQKYQTPLAKGDLLRLTNNAKTLENTKINNGTRYHVQGFTRAGDIKLSNGKTLSKDNGHFKHAYAETSHSAQGKDAQDVYVSVSDLSFSAASREQFYVSVSRGTHSATIYTSDKDALKTAIAKSSQRITAREIADDAESRMMHQKQQAHLRDLNEKIKGYERPNPRERTPERTVPARSK